MHFVRLGAGTAVYLLFEWAFILSEGSINQTKALFKENQAAPGEFW
jgi:hypothetical protein